MIVGLKKIGEIFRYEPWETALTVPKGGKGKIVKVDFRPDRGEVGLEIEDYSPGKERRYRFVSLRLTGSQNQPFVTFSQPKRLFGERGRKGPKRNAVWLSILDEAEKLNVSLPDYIREVEEVFYEERLLKEGYAQEIKERLKEADLIRIGKDGSVSNKDVAFWTISVDGEVLAEKDFYSRLLNGKILEEVLQEGEAVCSLCNTRVNRYITDMKRLPLKFFINNEWGYSQGLSDRWEGNFVLCEECYVALLGGFRFVKENLSARVGAIDYLIVPEIVDTAGITKGNLEALSDYVKDRLNPFRMPEDVHKMKEEELQFSMEGKPFNLTYVFYGEDNARLNTYGTIEDVPRGVVEEVIGKVEEVSNTFREIVGDRNVIRTLGEIYRVVPLRDRKGKILDAPKIVSLFSAVMRGERVALRPLVRDFTDAIASLYHDSETFKNVKFKNARDPEGFPISYVLKTNQLLVLLGKKGGYGMEKVPEPYRKYLEEARFNEEEAALFLLGAVMGSIGVAQFKKHDYAPILNKINFQGMDVRRLMQLYNEVYERLHQMKLNTAENETLYALSKEMFDRNRERWSLAPYENVYYIMSGYAFKKALVIGNKKGGEG